MFVDCEIFTTYFAWALNGGRGKINSLNPLDKWEFCIFVTRT